MTPLAILVSSCVQQAQGLGQALEGAAIDPQALQEMSSSPGVSPVTWLLLLVVMALMPFVLTMVTSFAKLVVVGGIVRQAIGTPQIPPTSVLTGLALILSVHIMSPVLVQAWGEFQDLAEREPVAVTKDGDPTMDRARLAARSTEEPMRRFLEQHSSAGNVDLFRNLRKRLYHAAQRRSAEAGTEPPRTIDLGEPTANRLFELATVYAPAFILTELTEAFQIGFLIFVPFLVIDLVVSNLLLAMGMHMLSPVTVSLPLKLLLFVLIDGWTLILQGIVLGYTG